MFSVDLSTREGGHVIVALRGELDVLDAADVAGALVLSSLPPMIPAEFSTEAWRGGRLRLPTRTSVGPAT